MESEYLMQVEAGLSQRRLFYDERDDRICEAMARLCKRISSGNLVSVRVANPHFKARG